MYMLCNIKMAVYWYNIYFLYTIYYSELSGRLALCCEVVMNVCITESEAAKNDETFTSIGLHTLQIGQSLSLVHIVIM